MNIADCEVAMKRYLGLLWLLPATAILALPAWADYKPMIRPALLQALAATK